MKKIFLIALLSSTCFGAGPKYNFKDPLLTDEFVNVYKDIKTVNLNRGTSSSSNAQPGEIGEYVFAIAPYTNCATTGQYKDYASIFLTPGDWSITGQLGINATTTTSSAFEILLSTYSGNVGTMAVAYDNDITWPHINGAQDDGRTISAWRRSLSEGTTVYLKGSCSYTVITPQMAGRISAIRIR